MAVARSESGRDGAGRPRGVITGMGLITPCGLDLDATWARLLAGKSGIGPISHFDTSGHKTKIAGEAWGFEPDQHFDAKTVRRNDRSLLLALVAADEAVRRAAFTVEACAAHRVGVVVGSGLGGLQTLEANSLILDQRGPGRISPFFISAVIPNLIPGQISIRTGAKGPNWAPVSACASGSHAIGQALELIRSGVCDVVICGGAEATITPLGIAGFNAMRALSTRNDDPESACRPWDADRDGFVMSEGAGILVLESYEHAAARGAPMHCEVVGYAASADAHHITAPSGEGAAECMRLALRDAALAPEAVNYINAHATSTPVGDLQELQAIGDVFGSHAKRLAVSSTKSMHGHLLGATGAVEAILCARMLEEGVILPTLNLRRPPAGCDFDLVPDGARRAPLCIALSNSFGFGGTNASLLFAAISD